MKQTKNTNKLSGDEQEGVLIAHFGANAEVETPTGEIIRCHLRKNQDPVITGDQVYWQPGADNIGVVVGHKPRKSLLWRPENHKKNKYIAANIDAIIITSAPPPIFSEYLIDRYLIAAENLNITPVILFNKTDLLTDANREKIIDSLAIYQKIGYRVIYSSIFTTDGLKELGEFLHDKTCVLVGTSGVGKSSLIAKFAPEQKLMIGETSASGLGKHTTTTTRLYHLVSGGNLIDSPGIREFSLWHMDKEAILNGFPEFLPYLKRCKYRNCQHGKEAGCAVQEAVTNKLIHRGRFESYLEMIKDL